MSNYLVTDTELHSIANAIQAKGATSAQLEYPTGFVSAVQALPQMTDPMYWLGKDVELYIDNFYLKEFTLYDTLFNGWTPSTTAKDILATINAGTFVASDMPNYDYYIVWDSGVEPAYTGTPTLKAHTLFTKAYQVQQIYRRPSTWVNIQGNVFDGGVCSNAFTQNFMRYYGSTAGTITYTWATSYGFYYTLTAATFSKATNDNPTMTVKTPKLSARCSTTYFSTGNAALVDQLNSKCWISCKIYRVKKNGIYRGAHEQHTAFINSTHVYQPIAFTIGETDCEADLGSTWQGWVDSAYNTVGATVSESTIVIGTSTVQYSSTNVAPSDAIVSGRAYTLSE